ncbi:DUF443 family protein [Staphylococcus pettenkoferi]|nr:DUF443 family protein [Staphylococcus pettenkoferi]
MIDLNRNKLTFLFPLLNYFTRQKLIEINEDELQNIEKSTLSKERVKKGEAFGRLGGRIGISLFIVAKPILDYLDIPTKHYMNIVFVLLTILFLFIIKVVVNRNRREKLGVNLNKYTYKCFILPDKRNLFKNISLNIFFTIFFIYITLGMIIDKNSRIIFTFLVIVTFAFILFQNGILYNYYKTEGMRGRLIRNKK